MGRSTFILLWCASIASLLAPRLKLLALAQPIPGFINIDCGALNSYSEGYNKIYYQTDEGFTDSGKSNQVSSEDIYKDYYQLTKSLRSFPNGTRNCYTLKPNQGKNNTYLIRAYFWYGNYDGKKEAPTFDVYIDVNYWSTVNSYNNVYKEIMHVAQADYIQVCVVNTGSGIPYISALELRVLDNPIYRIESGSLKQMWRLDNGQSYQSHTRYPMDIYDRMWDGQQDYDLLLPSIRASNPSLSNSNDAYKVPWEVLRTADTVSSGNSSMSYSLTPLRPTGKWILYFHFIETQSLPSGQQREFIVSIYGNQFTERVTLEYLKPVTIVSTPVTGGPQINFSISSASNQSRYLPILNAIEIYAIVGLPNVPTTQDDVKAINDTKATYRVNKESWQGDPCVPSNYTWYGLKCSSDKPPRIISVNLSSSNLVGNIAPSLSTLSALESLDLSNNQLTGSIPETLANLRKLRILNLSGNKLNGSVPKALKRRRDDKTLDLRFDNDPDLCLEGPCPKKEAKNSILVPVVATVSVVFVICGITIWLIRRKQTRGMLRLRSFDHGEITRITGNFETPIGKGGFGNVYLGTLDDGTKVAVKKLSKISTQGDLEFEAEAKLVVHHGNLVSLYGYCDHSENKALVYEFMANGSLQQHLHGDKQNVLTWKQRLQIAVDVAKGLHYLHDGCHPPIIHRDLKAANILLNEKMQAKISDFGLSRIFTAESDAHVSSRGVGTPGYLDPQYSSTGILDKKSDIYSFGIILLELITGHPAMVTKPEGTVHIRDWANSIIESGDMQRLKDRNLPGEFDSKSAWKAAWVAQSCTQPTRDQRPDIFRVMAELNECLAIALASEKGPEDGKRNENIK